MVTKSEIATAFAPCRIAFAGGGTDLPAYAERYGGAVLSAAVSPGARVQVRPLDIRTVSLILDDFEIRADYGDPAEILKDARAEVALVGRTLAELRPAGGVEMVVRTGLPPGSGLGASGAVGVAVTYALHLFAGRHPPQEEVAEAASVIEIEKLGRPIGRQDQYAAAYGGLNYFHFEKEGVRREAVNLSASKRREFERYFMLFFSGSRRDSAEVLDGQRARVAAGDRQTVEALHRLKELAGEMRTAAAEADWPRFGEFMHEAWLAKKEVSAGITDEKTAAACARARDLGAWAVKVTGAGAGGFYLAMAPPAAQDAVAAYLADEGFERYDFAFDYDGVRALDEQG
jgi:galactokinase/mevalonate kinase-like predicted kinase